MDCLVLDDLIKIPKKSDASKEKKIEFSKNMMNLLFEEGYTATSEKYFFGGFSFCGAYPVFNFLKELDDTQKLDIITKITKGEMYKQNEKGILLKILIHLLSLFIVFLPSSVSVIDMLIRYIPYKAKTKSNTITKDLSSVLEKYFISEIKTDTIFPDLKQIIKEKEHRISFSVLFSDGLKEINSKDTGVLQKISKTLIWLDNKSSEDNTASELKILSEQSKHRDIQQKKERFEVNTLISLKETLQNDLSIITKAVEHISVLENELSFVKKDKKKIENEYLQIKTVNETLISEKLKLHSDIGAMKSDNTSKEKEILILKEEIEKQKSVLSIYSSDKQNSLNEQLNGIASKLKTHFLNYRDSLEMEMSTELGENLRNLVGDIFKTLVKAGIDTERRTSNG